MKRRLIALLTVLILILTLLSLTRAQDDLAGLLSAPNCEQACWLGISIGDPEAALLDAFAAHHIEYEKHMYDSDPHLIDYTVVSGYTHPMIYPGSAGRIVIFLSDHQVGAIELTVMNITIADVLAEYGAPSHILDEHGVTLLVYLEHGLIFSVYNDVVTGAGIRSSKHIIGAYISGLPVAQFPACSNPAGVCSIATATWLPGVTATLAPTLAAGCTAEARDIVDLKEILQDNAPTDAPQRICLFADHNYSTTEASNDFQGDTSLPVIRGDVTIDGHGAVIERSDGWEPFRLFAVDSTGHLTLKNITLRGGALEDNPGGAIINAGGVVTLENVTLENNRATDADNGRGGAIYNAGGTLTATGSIFSGNMAGVSGGAVFNQGGSVTISDSCFSGNTAPDNAAISAQDAVLTQVERNWWGSATGPSVIGSGQGDGTGENVLFAPFLDTAPDICQKDGF